MPVLTIRFINSRGFISRLITGETFSFTDHVEAMNRQRDAWVGAHAFTGIEARALNWADKDLIWCRQYDLPCTAEEYERAMAEQEADIGVKYDYKGIVGIMLRLRGCTSNGRKDCSHHVFDVMTAMRQRPPLNVLSAFGWMVTPETLHLSMEFWGCMDHSASVG